MCACASRWMTESDMVNTMRGGALKGHDILVVEDEPTIALDLQIALEDHGASVRTARTLARALERVEAQAPDAAILDVTLGQEKTCEPVARALQKLGVPFLLHSGDLDRQGELIHRLGAPVIAKPAANRELIERLSELLA